MDTLAATLAATTMHLTPAKWSTDGLCTRTTMATTGEWIREMENKEIVEIQCLLNKNLNNSHLIRDNLIHISHKF